MFFPTNLFDNFIDWEESFSLGEIESIGRKVEIFLALIRCYGVPKELFAEDFAKIERSLVR